MYNGLSQEINILYLMKWGQVGQVRHGISTPLVQLFHPHFTMGWSVICECHIFW